PAMTPRRRKRARDMMQVKRPRTRELRPSRRAGHRMAYVPAVEGLEERSVPALTMTPFGVPTARAVGEIVAGSDGNLWFAECGPAATSRITPAGVITRFALPDGDPFSSVSDLVLGGDGNVWFHKSANIDKQISPVEHRLWLQSRIGKITPQG